jgi:hypothetical protein
LPLRHSDFKWFTTSLIPAFSPRRRRNLRRFSENSRDWICRTATITANAVGAAGPSKWSSPVSQFAD